MTSIRLSASFALSLLATATLFWFLGMLIAVDPGRAPIPIIQSIDFHRHIPETEPVKIVRVKPVIEKPKPQSNVPTVIIDQKTVVPGNDPSDLAPRDWFDGGEGGLPRGSDSDYAFKGSGADRAAVPQLRIEPDFPAQAKARGIQGSITFRFTVAKDGSVKDIEILASEPPHVWDSATIRAVSNWKYQPAIKDGRPVEQVGLVVTYRYELER